MEYKNLVKLINLLASTPLWGDTRGVETLAKNWSLLVLADAEGEEGLVCSASMLIRAMEDMLYERRARALQDPKQ
jgi:hypothetical protein